MPGNATVGDGDVMVKPARALWWSVVSQIASVMTAPVLQVAADGRWESADVVPLADGSAPARFVIEQVAQGARNDVSVEILWPGQAFVGVRWPADAWDLATAAASRGFVALADGSPVPPRQAVEVGLLALLGTAPSPDLEFVELGAVNAWRSTGPERLWRRGEVLTAGIAESVLVSRPDLATCSHPLAVELAVTTPQPCWVGVYVSTGSGPIHRLAPQMVKNVLDRL